MFCTNEKYRLLPISNIFPVEIQALSHQVLGSQNRVCVVLSWSISDINSKFKNRSTSRSTTRVLIITVVEAADNYYASGLPWCYMGT